MTPRGILWYFGPGGRTVNCPSRYLRLAAAIGAGALGVQLAAPGSTDWWNWGVSFWGFLPSGARWGTLGILAAGSVATAILIGRRAEGDPTSGGRGGWIWPLAAAFCLGILFWRFRSATHFLGDAGLRIRNLADHRHGASNSVLDSFLLYRWFGFLEVHTGLRAETFLALISGLSGILFVVLLAWWTRVSKFAAGGRGFLLLLTATSGYMLVFFGYAEQYGPACLAVLLYLVVAERSIEGRGHPAWALLTFVVAVAVHRSSLALSGSALYVLVRYVRDPEGTAAPRNRRVRLGAAAVLSLFAALAVGCLFRGLWAAGRAVSVFVPLTPGAIDAAARPYSLLSGVHWVNVINQHLLLSPVGILLLPVFAVTGFRQPGSRGAWFRFLLLGAAPWLLLSAVWAPDLGAPRDWDVFSPVAFLYTFTAGVLAVDRLAGCSRRVREPVFALLVCASLFHTVPWVWVNASRESARDRFERLIETEKSWGTFAVAYAAHEMGAYFLEEEHDPGRAAGMFERAAEVDPGPRYDYEAGIAWFEAGEDEKAALALARAVKRNPRFADAYVYLGMIYVRQERREDAIVLFERALELDPDLPRVKEAVEVLRQGGTVRFRLEKIVHVPVRAKGPVRLDGISGPVSSV